MATLRSIAEDLGLSESTVSRVLNGTGRISDETREAVLAYAHKVDYHPNRLARSLKNQRANAIGVVLPDVANEYYAHLFRHLDQILRKEGIVAMLFDSQEDPDREEEFLEFLHTSVVDNLIVATSGSYAYSKLPKNLLDKIVFVDNQPLNVSETITLIESDNVRSAQTLTNHLVEQGRRDIATITGPLTESSAQQRLLGLRLALNEHGLSLPDEHIVETSFLYTDGYAAAKELIARMPRPMAVIAQNNVLGYAAIRVCNEMGLDVPGDVAVACFDHIDTYGFIRPVVTSVVQPPEQLAAETASALLALIESPDSPRKTVILPAEFRQGETT